MAPNKFTSLFVTATALLLLAAAVATANEDGGATSAINPYCRSFKEQWLCTRLVRGATNWHDAVFNAITSMRIYMVKRINKMENELKSAMAAADPALQKEIVETCHDDMEQRFVDLESSFVALKANDIETVVKKITVGAHDACFFKLQSSKKQGFDTSEGPYYVHNSLFRETGA